MSASGASERRIGSQHRYVDRSTRGRLLGAWAAGGVLPAFLTAVTVHDMYTGQVRGLAWLVFLLGLALVWTVGTATSLWCHRFILLSERIVTEVAHQLVEWVDDHRDDWN